MVHDMAPCYMLAPGNSLPTNNADVIGNAGTDAVLDWTGNVIRDDDRKEDYATQGVVGSFGNR